MNQQRQRFSRLWPALLCAVLFGTATLLMSPAQTQPTPAAGDAGLAELISSANRGDATAQYRLAQRYSKGEGVPANRVEAYYWFSLAIDSGKREALTARFDLAASMTQQEIADAQAKVKLAAKTVKPIPSGNEKRAAEKSAEKPATKQTDVVSSFSVTGGGAGGLKDIEGGDQLTGPDGTTYTVCTGETVESGDFAHGAFIAISGARVQARSANKIRLEFDDKSTRTWEYTDTTPICDEAGKKIGASLLTNGVTVTIRWKAPNKAALNNEAQGQALSIRRGGIRYRFIDPNGRIVPRPTLADCSCASP